MATGVLPMIYDQGDTNGRVAEVGKSYITLQFQTLQAVFEGGLFTRTRQVAITSQVDVSYASAPKFSMPGLQYTQEMRKGEPVMIGLNRNLVTTVPTNMSHLSVHLDFTVDRDNLLVPLAELVNKGAFSPILKALPGADLVAKEIGSIALQLMTALGVNAQSQGHLLSFQGDFNIQSGQFRSGYYIIMGSPYADLPTSTAKISLDAEKRVRVNGYQPQHLTYVVLHAQVHTERGRESVDPATPWLLKLRQAEDDAEDAVLSMANAEEREKIMRSCFELIKEVRVLLRNDAGFIEGERNAIIQQSFLTVQRCLTLPAPALDQIASAVQQAAAADDRQGSLGRELGNKGILLKTFRADLSKITPPRIGLSTEEKELLGVSSMEELQQSVAEYEAEVERERPVLRSLGVPLHEDA